MYGYDDAPPLDGIRDDYTERDEATCLSCEATGDADVRTVIANSGVRTRLWSCEDCGEDNELSQYWVHDYEGSRWETL